jgi:ATP-binding cassette subfamily C (CFTR/MRP) protein 4
LLCLRLQNNNNSLSFCTYPFFFFREEVSFIYKVYLLLVAKFTLSDFILNVATYTFIVGSLWFGKQIKIQTIFFLIDSLNVLSTPLKIRIPRGMHEVIKLFVVIRRIEQFLKTPNAQLPSKRDCKNETFQNITLSNLDVYVKNQKIFENVNLDICNGLNVLTGPIGSGKSVLMQILLQEYQIDRGSMTITSKISYASEQPWLFPSTIKQNILVGAKYDKERYLAVLQVCALLPDLHHLQRGDTLIIADRGTNLSKGQQSRINLARAIYRDSEIYLLDGCLSNLDVLVADYIFEKCIKQFLKDKLVILVTQNPKHISRADSVITLSNQTAQLAPVSAGSFPPELCNTMRDQKKSENKITEEGEEEEEDELHETMNLLAETQLDKNIYQEMVEGGRLKFQKYVAYVQKGGGLISFFVVCIVFVLAQFSKIGMQKLENNWYVQIFLKFRSI